MLLLILSIYVVIELYVSTVIDYPPDFKVILEWIDLVICMFFLYDFFTGIWRVENRWNTLKFIG